DLEKAYSLIAKNQTPTVWYLGEGAICSIMADIYMWKKDYPNAVIWFKRLFAAKAPTGKVYNSSGAVVTGGGGSAADLQPASMWNSQFTNPAASVESIFTIHWDFTANGCACMAGISRTDNEPYIRMADPLWTNWPKVATATYGTATSTVDIRVKQTYNITSATNQPIRDRSFWKFYAGTFTPANPGSPAIPANGSTPAIPAVAPAQYTFAPAIYNSSIPATRETNVYIPLYRLSGMYLLYAEALNKSGDKTNAIKYLNLIKSRAAVPTVTEIQFPTELAIEGEILKERQYELIGEGVRWFDLVRTDRVKEVMDPILIARQTAASNEVVGWGNDKGRYYWPLATRVLYSNRLLVQNQSY
ncbi:MAG: RagB/SusD domain protein, partial [Daejeonella sp.]|nr:RagB/SusD domain protein [Daejeonella sp.]